MNGSVLYISYDGILEPLGQSQVLAYLEGLSSERTIYLISFEKPLDKKNKFLYDKINKRINQSNIQWYALTYHKKPAAIATLWDIFYATILSFWLVFRHDIKIVHARSYVASVSALVLKKFFNVSYIFDMRGFWADERIESEVWSKNSRIIRISKKLEKSFLLNADTVISLTHKAVSEMKSFPYLRERMPQFEVITTCTNLELFKPKFNIESNNKSITVGYVGSVDVWYLFEEALDYYKLIKKAIPDARLHILNRDEHDYIKKCLDKAKINQSSVIIENRDHSGVVRAMQSMDIGLFMIKPLYSKIASMPTKLGEFLGCGVPCVCNDGIGDMTDIINSGKVGIVLNSFDKVEKEESIARLLKLIKNPKTKQRCRETALKNFSLEDGVDSYNKIYHSLDARQK